MRTRIDLILGVTLALGTVGTIRAASLDVPAEYPTIQDAIDAASTGDEILVAPGTYTGDGFWRIDFGGKDLRLRGTGGAEATILDLENFYGPAFVFDSGETAASLVEGFSILDVRGNSLGGAFRIIGASPTISKCLIAGNQAVAFMVAFGGGLYIANGSPTLVDCTIAENLASTDAPPSVDSGGIFFGGDATLTLRRTIVWNNCEADIVGEGANAELILDCCAIDTTDIEVEGPITVLGDLVGDPLFCEEHVCSGAAAEDYLDYRLNSSSPCLPANNACGELIGVFGVGCPVSSAPPSMGGPGLPRVMLSSPFPNPSRGRVQSTLDLSLGGQVSLSVFDTEGRLVDAAWNGWLPAGQHPISWNRPRSLGDGLYYLRLEAHGETRSQKVVLR